MADQAEESSQAQFSTSGGHGGQDGPWPLPWQEVAGKRGGALRFLEYMAVRGTLEAAERLPDRPQRALVSLFARAARRLARGEAKSAREFLEQAFGPELDEGRREELVLASFRHLFTLMVRDARWEERVPWERLFEHYEVELCPDAERVLRERRPAILVGGHAGDWEALPPLVARLGFAPLYVVSRPPHNRYLARWAQEARERRGFRLIHRHGAVEAIGRATRAGASVGLMVDQRAHGRTALAPLFGRPAHCERSVGVLLRRLRVPVIAGACWLTERRWRYRAALTRVWWPDELAGASPEEVMTLINAELERMILSRPEQYLWLHERYRKAPPAPEAGRAGGATLQA